MQSSKCQLVFILKQTTIRLRRTVWNHNTRYTKSIETVKNWKHASFTCICDKNRYLFLKFTANYMLTWNSIQADSSSSFSPKSESSNHRKYYDSIVDKIFWNSNWVFQEHSFYDFTLNLVIRCFVSSIIYSSYILRQKPSCFLLLHFLPNVNFLHI